MVVREPSTSKDGFPQPVRASKSGNERRFAAMMVFRTTQF
jgi:hypothetical protein